MARGILKPSGSFGNQKDKETYRLSNESSFLNTKSHDILASADKALNYELFENTEELREKVFDANTIKYKSEILNAYREMSDPFGIEIVGDFDYE